MNQKVSLLLFLAIVAYSPTSSLRGDVLSPLASERPMDNIPEQLFHEDVASLPQELPTKFSPERAPEKASSPLKTTPHTLLQGMSLVRKKHQLGT